MRSAIVVSDTPIGSASKAPLLSLFAAPGTAAFFKPLSSRLNARRGVEPSDRLRALIEHQACAGIGAIRIGIDMAAYMGDLAASLSPDRLRPYRDLGLADADTLAICITPTENELHIVANLTLTRWRGLLGALGPNSAILERVPANYYWAADTQLDPNALLASVGGGRTGAQAILGAISGFVGEDLRTSVVDKMTGRLRAALAFVAPHMAVRYFEVPLKETHGAEQALRALEESAPHLPMPSGAPPHTIGVDVGLATLSPSMPLYLRVEGHSLVVASEASGLTLKTKPTPAQTAAVALLIDVARYCSLYKRVGRPADTLEWVTDFSAKDWLDETKSPEPAALLANLNRLRATLRKSDNSLTIDVSLTR